MLSLQASRAPGRPFARGDEIERRQRRGRHAHLGLHRANFGDQIDHPADFGFDRLVDLKAFRGPGPERQRPGARSGPPRP